MENLIEELVEGNLDQCEACGHFKEEETLDEGICPDCQ